MGATSHPQLDRLQEVVTALWPDHARFLRNSLAGYGAEDLAPIEDLARRVCALAGEDLDTFVRSYRWLCGEMNKEALHFKRRGEYRLSTFAEANAQV